MIHHVCVEKHITVVDGEPIPYGSLALLEDLPAVLPEMLDAIIAKVGKHNIVVCGENEAKRVLGRKLEDRLKMEVLYE